MPATKVNVFNGHDNTFTVTLQSGGSAVDLDATGVTRMVLRYGTGASECLDSDVVGAGAGQVFDWVTDGANGNVEFDLGNQSITAGTYGTTSLIVYDPTHPEGQVWHNVLKLVVYDSLACA